MPRATKTLRGASGEVYECPTIASIDRHLGTITERIHDCDPWRAGTLRLLHEDLDMLLDLRLTRSRKKVATKVS